MNYKILKYEFEEPAQTRLATGENYGILLVLKGTANIRNSDSLTPDDMLVCKPRQVIYVEHSDSRYPLFVFWVQLSTELMQQCSTPQTDIVGSFDVNTEPIAKIHGRSEILMLLKSLTAQLHDLSQNGQGYAKDLLEESAIKMFLALAIRTCVQSDKYRPKKRGHLVLDDVFRYIHAHLTEEITLEQLERVFFISRHHLIRQFKLHTGQTIHQYIIKSRLDLCRNLIEQGYAITEVYRMGGFGSYNHFFRAFKQEYHMTPKEYYRVSHLQDGEKTQENGTPPAQK